MCNYYNHYNDNIIVMSRQSLLRKSSHINICIYDVAVDLNIFSCRGNVWKSLYEEIATEKPQISFEYCNIEDSMNLPSFKVREKVFLSSSFKLILFRNLVCNSICVCVFCKMLQGQWNDFG